MQYALGLSFQQNLMFAITLALGIGGLVALFMALFWPQRWRLPYRAEVGFVVLLGVLGLLADNLSTATYQAYESKLPATVMPQATEQSGFDAAFRVLAFQWGFVFYDETGASARNVVRVRPGSRVLFQLAANDVIHGFNIPAARITAELDPESLRSVWILAPEKPGKYLIQCTNYCGLGHAQMKAWLVVADDAAPEA